MYTDGISLSCNMAHCMSLLQLNGTCAIYIAHFMGYINHSGNVYGNEILILRLISIYLPE